MSAAGVAIGPRNTQGLAREAAAHAPRFRLASAILTERALLAAIVMFAFAVRAYMALAMTPTEGPDAPAPESPQAEQMSQVTVKPAMARPTSPLLPPRDTFIV